MSKRSSRTASRSRVSTCGSVGWSSASAGWLTSSIVEPRPRASRDLPRPARARRGSRAAAHSSARRSRAPRSAPGRAARGRRPRRARARRARLRQPARAGRALRSAKRPSAQLCQAVGELVEAPLPNERGRLCPRGILVCEGRERGRGVQRSYSPVEPQVLRLGRESPSGQSSLERAVLAQDVCGLLGPDARGAGELVRRVSAERDEVRYLLGVDPVTLAHLVRADPRQLGDAANRLQDRRPFTRELERVAVRGGDERRAAALLLEHDRGREEGVRFITRRLGMGEPGRAAQLRQHLELLEERLVEDAPALVRLERLVAVGRVAERIPADQNRARLLRLPEPKEHVREADDAAEPDRLRHPVVGRVRERISIDDEERLHNDTRSSSIRAISRSVASVAACFWSSPSRSERSSGWPNATRSGPSRVSRSVPVIAAGTRGASAVSAMRAAPVCARAVCLLRRPLARRVPSGNITTISPARTRSTAVRIASTSPWPRRTLNAPPARRNGASTGLKSSDFAMNRR